MLELIHEPAKLWLMSQNLRVLLMASSLDSVGLFCFLLKLSWGTISLKLNVSDKQDLFFLMNICISSINPNELGTFRREQLNKVIVWSILLKKKWFFCGVHGEEIEKRTKKKRPSWSKWFRGKVYKIGMLLFLLYFLRKFCLWIHKVAQIQIHHICLLWLNFSNYTTILDTWDWCITSFFFFSSVIIVISVLYNQRSSQLIRISWSVVSEIWRS